MNYALFDQDWELVGLEDEDQEGTRFYTIEDATEYAVENVQNPDQAWYVCDSDTGVYVAIVFQGKVWKAVSD